MGIFPSELGEAGLSTGLETSVFPSHISTYSYCVINVEHLCSTSHLFKNLNAD